MFKLFQFLFDRPGPAQARYPEAIIAMALEHVVDSTDPRLRLLPGYQRRLRSAVLAAIDQVVAVVAGLPAAVEVRAASYGADPRLAAFFASPDHLRDTLRQDGALRDYLAGPGRYDTEPVYALLVTERRERTALGMELHGEMLQREVMQVTVSFSGQRLVDAAPSHEDLAKRLRRRAFDHLLALALRRITGARETRADLQRQRLLLQRKLDTLEGACWGFTPTAPPVDAAAVEAQLAAIEA